ncbi:hypothetical protein [Streptomyces chartreusis]|uniref:hypothetical protein n=1 Tax=Streptomyces chartreusis TaxID=1969 RepID=UPI00363804E0
MIVEISRTGSITLTQASEFRSFKVVAAPGTDLDEALRAAGAGRTADGDHVAVETCWLLTAAGSLAEEPGWRSGYDAMISYAASKGWFTDDRISAHVEYHS